MMALLGNSYSMRGYYEGRYRDKHKIEGQVELRQHVWKRNGVVVWIGAGTVFNKFSALCMDRVLPNYGIGYRWEFKKNVNVRLDYGFGKNGQSGFIFNINEAFLKNLFSGVVSHNGCSFCSSLSWPFPMWHCFLQNSK